MTGIAGMPTFTLARKNGRKSLFHGADQDGHETVCGIPIRPKVWYMGIWRSQDIKSQMLCPNCRRAIKERTAAIWADARAQMEAAV